MQRRVSMFAVGALGTFLLVAWYRSFIDNAPYPQSFDGVIMTVLADAWHLLMSPIVLTAVIVLLLLSVGRKLLVAVLGAVEELRAGIWTARFNREALAEALARWIEPLPPTTAVPGTVLSQELRDVVARMDSGLCLFLLNVAGRPMTMEAYAGSRRCAPIRAPRDRDNGKVDQVFYCFGILFGNRKPPHGTRLFNTPK